ncbi:MAG: RNA 2',3'-cyclic phosphodiesterase [Thermoleophilaceae bacterium]
MAKRSPSERPGSPRARLFLALELPDETRSALVEWRSGALDGRSDLRPVAPEALHVTLIFLGYQYEKEIERIAATAFDAVRALAPPFLEPAEVVPVPRARDPRLFALDLVDPAGDCAALQLATSDALAAGRFYKPEKRPFWPHVTLARVKRDVRRAPPVGGDPPALDPFTAPLVTLYRSVLRREGARYEPLEQLTLGQ